MRIVSKQSDYYDGAQGLGVDLTKTFVRELSKGPEFPLPDWHSRTPWGEESKSKYPDFVKEKYRNSVYTPLLTLGAVYILLTGKLYGGIRVVINNSFGNPEKPFTIWTEEELNTLQETYSIWNLDKKKRQYEKWGDGRDNYWTALRVLAVRNDDILYKWAVANNIVIAAFGHHTKESKNHNAPCYSEINPLLKDYNFQKVLDPYTVYQELDMYINGVLGQNKEPDEVADKYKIQQHGYDRWSFRKHKLDNVKARKQ